MYCPRLSLRDAVSVLVLLISSFCKKGVVLWLCHDMLDDEINHSIINLYLELQVNLYGWTHLQRGPYISMPVVVIILCINCFPQ